MNQIDKIAVCSRSFSKNKVLREKLLSRYANVTFNDRGLKLAGTSLVDFLSGHNKAITALETIDEFVLSQLPELQVIGKYGVGLDMIDLDAMRRYGKKLGWTSGVNRRSVSELALCFAIMMLRKITISNREMISGSWQQHTGAMLTGRTVGIIGCGHIGKDLVGLLRPFECPIIVTDIINYADFYSEHSIIPHSLDDLLRKADIVTLHIPLNSSTNGLISASRLALMKSEAILINVARGGLVDELALKNALKNGHLGAAAFDVFSDEPPTDNELLNLPNFISTPHIGGSTEEAIVAMGMAAIHGLDVNSIP